MANIRPFIVAVVLVTSVALLACSSGVPQEEYDEISSLLVATESKVETLTTKFEQAQQRVEELEAMEADMQEKLKETQTLSGQRGSKQKKASAYLEVALAVFNFEGASSDIDEVAKLSAPLVKLGVQDATYQDLTTRMLRATDPREAQRLYGAWLFYTFDAALDALKDEGGGAQGPLQP